MDDLHKNEKITADQFYTKIEAGMKAKGYEYDVDQCMNKMEGFKRAYKNHLLKRGKTGRPPKDLPYGDVSYFIP